MFSNGSMSPIDLSYGIRKRENKGKAKNNDQLLEYMCRVLKTSLCQPQSKLIMSQSAKNYYYCFFFFFFFFFETGTQTVLIRVS